MALDPVLHRPANKKTLLLLSAAWPYGTGEVFLENELPWLLDTFKRVMVLPMFSPGRSRLRPLPGQQLAPHHEWLRKHSRLRILAPTPPTQSRPADFWRGIRQAGKRLLPEWRRSPRFPVSPYGFYLCSRTLGIARRIETRILREAGPYATAGGVIYCYWMNQACAGAVMAGPKLQWPIVARAHGGDLYTERYPGNFLPFQGLKANGLDYIAPISRSGEQYLRNRYPKSEAQISVKYLGVTGPEANLWAPWTNTSTNASAKQTPPANTPEQSEPHAPGSGDTLHLASCSSVIPIKRVEYILDTVLELFRLWVDGAGASPRTLRWTHIGDGPGLDKLRKRVKTIRHKGLEIHLPGLLPNRQVMQLYQKENVDLFVNYSRSEGIPVSIMEAFSCGIPAAAPQVGGIPEIVHEQTGILFNVDTPPVETAALIHEQIVNNKLAGLGAAAKTYWHTHFNAEKNYRDMARYLSSL